MKPYHVLNCPGLEEIQNQVMNWLTNKNVNLLESSSLWNKINTVDMVKDCPALTTYLRQQKFKLREASITVMNKRQDATLHIDEMPVTAKVNIPIHNTKNTFNRWYDIPADIKKKFQPIVNEFGKKFYSFDNIDYNKIKLLGEIELLSPVVFNSQIAHNIVLGEQCELPRVVLACTFFNEPTHLLQN